MAALDFKIAQLFVSSSLMRIDVIGRSHATLAPSLSRSWTTGVDAPEFLYLNGEISEECASRAEGFGED
jgi:hypothetical protein